MIQSLKIVTPIAVALAITACSSNEGSLIAPATATQGTVPGNHQSVFHPITSAPILLLRRRTSMSQTRA